MSEREKKRKKGEKRTANHCIHLARLSLETKLLRRMGRESQRKGRIQKNMVVLKSLSVCFNAVLLVHDNKHFSKVDIFISIVKAYIIMLANITTIWQQQKQTDVQPARKKGREERRY